MGPLLSRRFLVPRRFLLTSAALWLTAKPMSSSDLPQRIRKAAVPLPEIGKPDFAEHFDRFVTGDAASARVVLIGDGSHGTSEFYASRAEITKRLIDKHGFTIVAVEADWPDAAAVDRHVRSKAAKVKRDGAPFQRFPGWMWKNEEVKEFVDWLRARNDRQKPEDRAGFYGLDLYSLDTSIKAVLEYLDRTDPNLAKQARQRYGCLAPYAENPARYGAVALGRGFAPCEKAVMDMLQDMLKKRLELIKTDAGEHEEEIFDAEQNAHVVADAEKYYRAMYYGNDESWNLRDTHFFNTLNRLLEMKKPPTAGKNKAVVWAHNSHVGDARFTGMGQRRNELNVGQLCKQQFGKDAVIIGHGTHTGTVAAANEWEDPMSIMRVRESRPDTYERLAHDTGLPRFVLDLRQGHQDERLRNDLSKARLQRFIGVIYRPETELLSHYESAIMPKQFDAYVWFDQTSAVRALGAIEPKGPPETLETYPFGM
ncbi:putative erythromycin esterase [Lyophyllum shimeji]|uniref:Erythromycin esterase n=1 Tax=Lyophyllum shimeji TaxID=47721 RepID=A0A9P3PXB4_LYOSH|nr:putative erythromycin esterase [Lyophyllum shimeji]